MSKVFETDKHVFFYGTSDIYSNFHPVKFTVNGNDFTCSEQYFMHAKAFLFKDFTVAKKILEATEPRKIKSLGRQVENFNEETWHQHREQIMFDANLAKFTQNPDLEKQLLATHPKLLVEASPSDTIWGVGLGMNNPDLLDETKWKGTNLLGKSLVRVREHIMKNKNTENKN